MKFRHPENPQGLVKSRITDEFRSATRLLWKPRPRCIFIGDGVSNYIAGDCFSFLELFTYPLTPFYAAGWTNLLFVKVKPDGAGVNDLKEHCDRLRLPNQPSATLYHALNVIGALVESRVVTRHCVPRPHEREDGDGRLVALAIAAFLAFTSDPGKF